MDSDAEWVGVDFEFGNADPAPTSRPPVQPRPRNIPPTISPKGPPTDSPHDAPEVKGTTPTLGNNAAIVGGTVGGVLGVVLLLLMLYMLALRRKLSKAKDHGKASKYQLRVEDVAHLTNIDETTNTYVNTTDLQRLVSSVRAKNKSENRLPTPPRIQYQTPKPYRPSPGAAPPRQEDNEGFRSDVVVVRAPMPLPNPAAGILPAARGLAPAVVEEEEMYSNLNEVAPHALPSALAKVQAPKIAPPPPPSKLKKRASDDDSSNSTGPASPTAVARPAPPPPVVAKGQQAAGMASPPQAQKPTPPQAQKPTPPQAQKPTPPQVQKPTPPQVQKPTPPQVQKPTPPQAQKPIPPPVACKPNKGQASEAPASTATPWKSTPPTLPKPGVLSKGRGLPPLKMALLPSISRSSLDDLCNTPDTSIIELTPDSTPTTVGKTSIGAKVAFLEGKLKTPAKPARSMVPRT